MALNDVPLAPQTLAQSQNPIRLNFTNINAGFLVDHQEFNTGVTTGFHNKVSLNPNAAVVTTDNGIWSQNYAGVTNVNEIWVQNVTPAGFNQIPMCSSTFSTSAAPTLRGPNWTYLPSGFVIKFATATLAAGGSIININSAIWLNAPVLVRYIHVFITPNAAGATFTRYTVGADDTHFVAYGTGDSSIMIIGY